MYSFFTKKILVFFFFFANSVLAWGQLTSTTTIGQSIVSESVDGIIQQQQLVVETLKRSLEDLKKKFEFEIEDKHILDELRFKAQDISKRAIDVAFVLRSPLNDINMLLDQLTELRDDHKNSEDQAKNRSTLIQQKTKINNTVRQLEEIFLAANRVAENASSQSRELFTRTLTHRFEFSRKMIKDIIEITKETSFDFVALFNSWLRFVCYFKPLQLFFAFFIPFIIALGLSHFVRKGIAHVRCRIVKGNDEVPYLQRLLVAFISILLPSFVCVFCVYLMFCLFLSFGLDLGKLTGVFYTVGHQIILVFLVNRVAVALFSPAVERIRLFNISPLSAYQLIVCLTLLAVVLSFDAVSDSIYQVVAASLSFAVAKSFIAVFLVGVLLLIISFLPLRFRRKRFKNNEEKLLPWPFYIRVPLIVLGLFLIVTDFLGYIGLARFIMQQIVISSAFLALMYLGIQSTRVIASEGEFVKTSVGQTLMKWFHLEEKTMNQLGIVSSIFLNLAIIMLCTMPIVMQFGFSHSDMMDVVWQLMTGFQIGNVSISVISIITGIIVFFVCWFLIRLFVCWLDKTVMVRGGFDSGVRNSIKTVISYGGIAASALMGLSMSGLDLKGFALIAGGLSLGIGFGLQNIVQNFVSGLIILIGRPFKLGDYIESGSVSGTVKRINVRATELETFRRQRIIIPNSSLINNNVSNWTRPSKMGRVDIPLTVSTNINPERVVEILLETASFIDNVLKNPAPQVSFTAFDSKHFSFILAIYVPNIVSTSEVTNTLRFVLYKRFVEEGILE